MGWFSDSDGQHLVRTLLIVETSDNTLSRRVRAILRPGDWDIVTTLPETATERALKTAALLAIISEQALAATPGLVAAMAQRVRTPIGIAGGGDARQETLALQAGATAYFDLRQPNALIEARLEVLLRRHPFAHTWPRPRRGLDGANDSCSIAWLPTRGRSHERRRLSSSGAGTPARASTAWDSFVSNGSLLLHDYTSTSGQGMERKSGSPAAPAKVQGIENGREGHAYTGLVGRQEETPGKDKLPGVETEPGTRPENCATASSIAGNTRPGSEERHQAAAGNGPPAGSGGPPKGRTGWQPHRKGTSVKRLITALMLTGVMVAAAGFAATFAINGNPGQEGQEDIAAADTLVDFCNHNVEFNIDGEFANGEYQVSDVYVQADNACEGWTASVTLTEGGVALAEMSAVLDANGDATLDFRGEEIAVAVVDDAHIQIDNTVGPV